MAQVKFISDLHLGHLNVAIWRNFKDMEDHHEHIIKTWNANVHKKDKVYVLGDIALNHKFYYLLDRLNGNKTFVLGNHDEDNNVAELLKYGKVCGAVKYKSKYWLTHIPIHPECLQEYQVNIHGHLHDLLIRNHSFMAALDSTAENKKRYFNVSCEQVNFIPQTLHELGLE